MSEYCRECEGSKSQASSSVLDSDYTIIKPEGAVISEFASPETLESSMSASPHSHKLLTTTFEKDVVYLYQFGGYEDLRSISPYCTKLEIWLQMTGIAHKVIDITQPGPSGKAPFIELNGILYEESSNVIQVLTQHFKCDIDASLTPTEKSISLAFQRLVEEHLSFHLAYYTFVDDKGFEEVNGIFGSILPAVVRNIVPRFVIRPRVIKTVNLQGIGGMADPIRIQRFQDDFQAPATYLGDKPYFMGDNPTTIDACVFGFLHRIGQGKADTKLKETLMQHTNLTTYADRLRQKYFASENPANGA